jgi:hypothetical protein
MYAERDGACARRLPTLVHLNKRDEGEHAYVFSLLPHNL